MVILRRFDAVLEPTKQAVLAMKAFSTTRKGIVAPGPVRFAW